MGAKQYPEHEKLHKIAEQSQAIGEFLDFGLPQQHLVLYDRFVEPCKCHACRVRETETITGLHADADHIRDGIAYYIRYRPTMKTIKKILSDHFEIDQDKIDQEKEEMLTAQREANSR